MGMMAVGKTTIGRSLAHRLGVPYRDNDDALRLRTGCDAASIANHEGVEALHRLEHEILRDALAAGDGAVIGAPGSVALDPAAPGLLRGAHVVWLRAQPATLAQRIRNDPVRPLVGDAVAARITGLMEERAPGFDRLATCAVDVDGRTVEAIVDRVIACVSG